MKQLTTIVAIMLILVACKSKNNENAKVDTLVHKEYYGNWVGVFVSKMGDNRDAPSERINIKIMSINNKRIVEGQCIRASIKCMLKGTFNDITHKFSLEEVNSDTAKGKFEFEIKNDTLKGKWIIKPISEYGNERTYVLQKKQFIYDSSLTLPELWYNYSDFLNEKYTGKHFEGYGYSYRESSSIVLRMNASTTDLKEDSLKNLKKIDLEIIRNTIYARHGFIFKDATTRQYFVNVDWYVPLHDNVDSQLTPLEVKNITLLKRFEKYAKENYHTFYR